MSVEIYRVEGASSHRGRDEPESTVGQVESAISDAYSNTISQGGRIIGGHTLRVDEVVATGLEGNTATTAAAQTEYLFLVAEFPDQPPANFDVAAATYRADSLGEI